MLRDAIDRLEEKLHLVDLPSHCVDYLRSLNIPEDIVHDLTLCVVEDWIPFGPITLLPMSKIIEQNEGVSACVNNGVLALAAGTDGSPIVLDPRDRRMYFVEFPKLSERIGLCFGTVPIQHPTSTMTFGLRLLRTLNSHVTSMQLSAAGGSARVELHWRVVSSPTSSRSQEWWARR